MNAGIPPRGSSVLRGGKESPLEFRPADEGDDEAIRRLLRENPMQGGIRLSFEREPSFFLDADMRGEARQTLVAREGAKLLAVGSCTVASCFVNGQVRRVAYLSALRLDRSHMGRADILLRGYRAFRELQRADPPDFFFTSISSDNDRARRFLERGLPGMPEYEFLGEYLTLLLPIPRKRRGSISRWTLSSMPPERFLPRLIDQYSRSFHFAPRISESLIAAQRKLGLDNGDFLVMEEKGVVTACAALWDQRCFKQSVVRGYSTRLRRIRPLLNLAAKFSGRPCLPPVGSVVSHASLSFAAMDPRDSQGFVECVEALRHLAAERGLDYLSLGLAAADPRVGVLRRRSRHREYRSRIYVVSWPEMGGSLSRLDDRLVCPELAWL
ncbi:MAG: hypothetical protein DRJ61_09695 [Acidobacteria bacterium]|nr:MAG: hypothetical protein DRJ65_19175 [Acidobacteriota bacterium]RLE32348.1 MAG: hypothetical protein DRJ61_09695 [Acidobacteriota bacterium]